MTTLERYGWNEYARHKILKTFQDNNNSDNPVFLSEHKMNDLDLGRVISIKGIKYILITSKGETESELSGKLLYGTEVPDLPKVGDWVYYIRYDTLGYIVEVLPRINELSRKNPGTKAERQVLAANIDHALIVQGLDGNFNIMRLERYLVQITASKIKPVVILNKSDLAGSPGTFIDEVNNLGRECPVFYCSTYTGEGIEKMKNLIFEENKTYMLIGSSGVGKSSLLNVLLAEAGRETGSISDSTGKGRHVTTTRDLFRLSNGSLLIDTPGMREFGIDYDEGQQQAGLFPVIDKFALHCRYADCTHTSELDCAVIEAYDNGTLEPAVYESYLKLMKERKRFELKAGDKKRLGKQFGKMIKEVKEFRKKYK